MDRRTLLKTVAAGALSPLADFLPSPQDPFDALGVQADRGFSTASYSWVTVTAHQDCDAEFCRRAGEAAAKHTNAEFWRAFSG